jgi:hypothetical protein
MAWKLLQTDISTLASASLLLLPDQAQGAKRTENICLACRIPSPLVEDLLQGVGGDNPGRGSFGDVSG